MMDDRRGYLGASDIGAVLGLSKFKSADELFLEKTGQKPPDPSTLYQECGTALEGVVLQRWARRTGGTLLGGIRYAHPQHPWLMARLDSEAVLPGGELTLVEAKTCSFSKRDGGWGPEGSEEVPGEYFAQIQAQLLLSRLNGRRVERAYLPCLFLNRLGEDDKQPQIFEVRFNEEMANAIVSKAQLFWGRVTQFLQSKSEAA